MTYAVTGFPLSPKGVARKMGSIHINNNLLRNSMLRDMNDIIQADKPRLKSKEIKAVISEQYKIFQENFFGECGLNMVTHVKNNTLRGKTFKRFA